MKEGNNIFSARLQELRKERGLSHQKMADILGIVKAAYGFYEQGRNYPNTETIIKIADFFGVSLDYLFGRTDKREMNK